MALRGEVVEFVGLYLLDDADQAAGVGQVAVVEDEAAVRLVRVLVEMVDAVGVEQRTAALDAVDDVALGQQEFGQVGAVLAGDAGDQGGFVHGFEKSGWLAWQGRWANRQGVMNAIRTMEHEYLRAAGTVSPAG